jgi:response regulator RpfG family c-di-GMP phosphodiesterase
MTRLGLDLAARLRVPAPERETLRQALEVLDVGRVWMEELLFPRAGFSDGEREALLREYSGHSVAILAALDSPPAVLELVGAHQAWWNGEGHPPGLAGDQIPMGARIMSVVAAYFDELGGAEGDEGPPAAERVFEALTREGGRRFDPAVVSALTAVDLPAR